MTATTRAVLIALFLLGIGLLSVHLEVENTRRGVRIRELFEERDTRLEKVRRLETRYNRMISPDVLERRLLEDFGPAAEYPEIDDEGA